MRQQTTKYRRIDFVLFFLSQIFVFEFGHVTFLSFLPGSPESALPED
jgi:hypothetical protein